MSSDFIAKSERPMSFQERVVKAAPVFLGLVFLLYGVSKLFDLNRTALAIGIVLKNETLSGAAAIALCALEIFIGLQMITQPKKTAPALMMLAMLIAFTGFLVYLKINGLEIDCGCGGLIKLITEAKDQAWIGITRNLILVAGLIGYFVLNARRQPIEGAT